MLELEQIADVAREVAQVRLGQELEEVRVKPMSDWVGRDSWDVLLIVRPSALSILTETDAVFKTLGELGERLQQMGEPRFPYVSYATRDELEAPDDPES